MVVDGVEVGGLEVVGGGVDVGGVLVGVGVEQAGTSDINKVARVATKMMARSLLFFTSCLPPLACFAHGPKRHNLQLNSLGTAVHQSW